MRMLVETSSGAGVGVGSPPKMPQAMVTGRTSAHTPRHADLLNLMIQCPKMPLSKHTSNPSLLFSNHSFISVGRAPEGEHQSRPML